MDWDFTMVERRFPRLPRLPFRPPIPTLLLLLLLLLVLVNDDFLPLPVAEEGGAVSLLLPLSVPAVTTTERGSAAEEPEAVSGSVPPGADAAPVAVVAAPCESSTPLDGCWPMPGTPLVYRLIWSRT
jgi:hypothetical protein